MTIQLLDSHAARAPRQLAGAGLVGLFALGLYAANAGVGSGFSGAAFEGNQNTYLLHALIQAGHGALAADWLAGTADPFPLFTAFARTLLAFLPPAALQLAYGLPVAVLIASLAAIQQRLLPDLAPTARAAWLALLILPWSAAVSLLPEPFGAALQALGSGVAYQYLLGGYLQPSEAGVLLVAAVALFLYKRPLLAAAAAAGACAIHPSYLLPASFLVAAFVGALAAERRLRQAAATAGLALLLVLPTLAHMAVRFGPTEAALHAEAAAILVSERLPHHALPQHWFGWTSLLSLMVVLGGLLAWHRDRRLLCCIGGPLLLALGGTVAVLALDRPAFYLLFPWRASVYLVPLAWALLLLAAAGRLQRRLAAGRSASHAAALLLGAALLTLAVESRALLRSSYDAALPVGARDYNEYLDPDFAELAGWVRRRAAADSLYLLPPAPHMAFESFRLRTGQPVFVDLKTHPYKDAELLEWWRRLVAARGFYAALDECGPAEMEAMMREGITHLVLARDLQDVAALRRSACVAGPAAGLVPRFENGRFLVFALAPAV